MNYLIRKKEIKDCKSIAHVLTLAWNETYRGIVPDWFLDDLKNNEVKRAKILKDEYDENNNTQYVLVVDNEVVGYVKYGISDDKQFSNCGEIIALYILKKCQGKSLGRKLVEKAINEIKNMGCDKMIIACLKGNSSNDFYKHLGGKYIKDGVYKRLNLPENIYYFDLI